MSMEIKYDKYVVSISYGNYLQSVGGVDKYIINLQSILNDNDISMIYLFDIHHYISKKNNDSLWGVIIDNKYVGIYDTISIINKILNNIGGLRGILIHHMQYINMDEIKKIVFSFNVNVLFFVHDYYSLCENIKLLKNDSNQSCDYRLKIEDRCSNCEYYRKTIEMIDQNNNFFNNINNLYIICPSKVCRDIFVGVFDSLKDRSMVIPHQVFDGINTKRGIATRIAYIGMPDKSKGYNIFKKIINKYKDYEFYQFGRKIDEFDNVVNIKVRFSIDNMEPMPVSLKENNIGVVLLWSIWPETYSYTYFEALVANCFVITNKNSGNIADQVKINRNGIVLNNEEELHNLLKDKNKLERLVNEYWNNSIAPDKIIYNDYFLKYLNKSAPEALDKMYTNDGFHIKKIRLGILYFIYRQMYKLFRAKK